MFFDIPLQSHARNSAAGPGRLRDLRGFLGLVAAPQRGVQEGRRTVAEKPLAARVTEALLRDKRTKNLAVDVSVVGAQVTITGTTGAVGRGAPRPVLRRPGRPLLRRVCMAFARLGINHTLLTLSMSESVCLYSGRRLCYNAPMSDEGCVEINPALCIPLSELSYRFSRAGGPGGQHVNKSATQVELLFDVDHSPSLSEEQRARIRTALGKRIDSQGVLHLFSSGTRSQLQNREEAVGRFQAMLRHALYVPRQRRPTRPSHAARQERVESKRRRGEAKARRGRVRIEE